VADYPSTHTVLGAAVATVMARFFNTDLISFSMTSGQPIPVLPASSGASRKQPVKTGRHVILCGIHFRTAVEVGYAQRERVGDWVFEHALRPAEPGPATTPFPESG
jgi:hypothetical protein